MHTTANTFTILMIFTTNATTTTNTATTTTTTSSTTISIATPCKLKVLKYKIKELCEYIGYQKDISAMR